MSLSERNKVLDHLTGVAPYTITPPLKVIIRNQNGDTIATQPVTFGASILEDGFWYALNTTAIVFPNFSSQVDVVSYKIIDSSATPRQIWQGDATRVRTVPAGDSYEIPAGALRVEVD